MPLGKNNAPQNDKLAQEHTLGDDPARTKAQDEAGYHDSMTGRPVDASGNLVDGAEGEGPVPEHRVVANNWPELQDEADKDKKRQ